MMSSLTLREVSTREESLKRYAQAAGKSYLTLTSPPQQTLIHIAATLNDRVVNLYCDVDNLLRHCSAGVEALPVEIIDKTLLVGLARRYFFSHQLSMPVSLQPVRDFTVQEIVDNRQIAYPLVSMAPTEAFIWAGLTDIDVPALPQKENEANWSNLELQAQIILGYTEIHYRDIVNLNCGDLLILDIPTFNIIVANKLIMEFVIEEDNMIVESMDEYDTERVEDNTTLIEASHLAVDNLELKVTFFLEERSMTLAELQNMQVNSRLPLHSDGSQVNVSLRVGKHVIANGELVRVDDKLAVEIHSINGTV
ncbi:hypothetical protein C3432_01910 [Citrobacter amalonaticus]|uniref:Uncharacterized protein n=1 Tax=Citrobacter amalonaticus TaxID=35703 RepID=A0A2S4S2J5_CITAM|nr:FliM/FliN family flagellar motor switch protein [Citrobacter amalonaticus]POT59502.1 hypothetical protein C3432_01910 [Citrobacter amalonaticus]POT77632.1 hypothetical protein C3436_09580 [Citrobacter amalonaticus]POU68084.1 hypothetical protein C3430_03115 [Citrobacter amalonaticus]POV07688.1 hypothetical protein C3424_03125 [Citrobacter amalonaticus]